MAGAKPNYFEDLKPMRSHLFEGLDRIRAYYLKKGFGWLSVQLGIPTGAAADYIEYKVYRKK